MARVSDDSVNVNCLTGSRDFFQEISPGTFELLGGFEATCTQTGMRKLPDYSSPSEKFHYLHCTCPNVKGPVRLTHSSH